MSSPFGSRPPRGPARLRFWSLRVRPVLVAGAPTGQWAAEALAGRRLDKVNLGPTGYPGVIGESSRRGPGTTEGYHLLVPGDGSLPPDTPRLGRNRHMYHLTTLGGLHVHRDGMPLDGAEGHRKALALLAVLAVAGDDGVSRDRVMALLWPHSDTAHARGALKQMLHTVRRMLASPTAVAGATQVRLDQGHVSSDVGRFRRALSMGDLQAAVDAYGGPFLDGFHLGGCPDFERWTDDHRMRLEGLYADALDSLARSAEEAGEPREALRWWRGLRDADPLSGQACAGIMRCLHHLGDTAAALREAQRYEDRVRRELGCGPGAAVSRLRDELHA